MFNHIDNFLNNITMYRLALYYLIVLVIAGIFASFFGLVLYGPLDIVLNTLVILISCVIANFLFSKITGVVTNVESLYITSLILALILPIKFPADAAMLILASSIAMGSKYLLVLKKHHIFNPAAFSAFSVGLIFNNGGAIWWVSAPILLPVVLIGGLLLVRKMKREKLIISFLLTYLIIVVGALFFNPVSLSGPLSSFSILFLNSSLLFFTFVMFTEPLTTPTRPKQEIYYAGFVAALYATPQFGIPALALTPEAALCLGNIFGYLISPNYRLVLFLKEKKQLAPDIYDFVFALPKKISFTPGQYMEWTLGHKNPDSRGNRRYFSLASSPTEDNVRLGVRFYPNSSSFKESLLEISKDRKILAGQLAGDFVLPQDKTKKLVFIAGGIGITPFRSIIKYLVDTNEKRDIVLFYINRIKKDIVYEDVFNEAHKKLGIEIVYSLTEEDPKDWKGEKGHLSPEMIREHVKDFKDRIFYVSGSRLTVTTCQAAVRKLGISSENIKKDYFPGYV